MKRLVGKIEEIIFKWAEKFGKRVGLDITYFVKNGIWVLLRQAILIISGLGVSVIFTRMTTQDVFGQYQLVLSILAMVAILSIPGLSTSLTRSIARGYEGDYKKAVRVSFLWSLLGVPTLLGVGVYYWMYQEQLVGIALIISAMFFPFFYSLNMRDTFFQAKGNFDNATKYNVIQVIVHSLAIIVVVCFRKDSLLWIVSVYLVSYTFFNIIYYFKSLKYIENNKQDKEIIRYGWFLTGVSILGVIASNIDKIIVGIFFSPAHLAVYSIGILVPKQLQNIVKSLLWITVPKQIKQGDISINNYFKIFLTTTVISIGVWFIIPALVVFLYSSKYTEAVALAQLAFLFFPVFIVSVLYKNKFLFKANKKEIAIEAIATPVIKITLMAIFIPIFGIRFLAFLFGFQYVIILVVLFVISKINTISLSQK
jgi:O-antigen/teichoic acid export membrane protein